MTISPRVFLAVVLLSVAALAQSNPQSESEKVAETRKAAQQGNPRAQVELADLYRLGQGVPQDYTQAALWYRKAAEQEIARPGARVNLLLEFSALQLGWLYNDGKGVPQDYKEAAKWYRIAADQGDAGAQNNLGVFYNKGEGVPQDYLQAHMWANLASAGSTGDEQKERAKLRDEIATKMTPEQIAEAQRLAREWKPNPAK